jgi:hypothetical protein
MYESVSVKKMIDDYYIFILICFLPSCLPLLSLVPQCMLRNISSGECAGSCVVFLGECVNECFVFTKEKDCVEDHCSWVENRCQSECTGLPSHSCQSYSSCLWLLAGYLSSGNARCINKV